MKKFFLLLFIFLLISCPSGDQYTTIKTGDTEMLKRIGEEFEIKVSIENAVQVVGLNAWITYDPAIVEVVDTDPATPGTQVEATDLGFFPSAQLLVGIRKDAGGNELPGTVVCGYAALPQVPKDGSGDAFTVLFRAIAQGTTNINFEIGHINLQDLQGDIPTNWFGDNVDVPVNATVRITVL